MHRFDLPNVISTFALLQFDHNCTSYFSFERITSVVPRRRLEQGLRLSESLGSSCHLISRQRCRRICSRTNFAAAFRRLFPYNQLPAECRKRLAGYVSCSLPDIPDLEIVKVKFDILTSSQTRLAYSKVWHHVSLSSSETPPLGRLASQIAIILMGKHKPIWEPGNDCGDYVVATGCTHVWATGKKMQQKLYYKQTTRPGALKALNMEQMLHKWGGGEILKRAVRGMLPKNRLREPRLARLKGRFECPGFAEEVD